MPENSPLALMGLFPSSMGRFLDLNGPFPRLPEWAAFPLENSLENSPKSEERQKPQPLLLEKVSQYASHLYCNTSPICIAVLSVPYALRKGKYCQYSSHLYRSTPPISIAIRLPFVSQFFWENLGGCGHWDVFRTEKAYRQVLE